VTEQRRPSGSRRLQPNPRRAATPLQRALLPLAVAMELAAELDQRQLEAFVDICAIRLAHEASRLRWWEAT
jgi:hypothetical protein